MSTVCMAGAGYVGLVTGACLAELGHQVMIVEIDPARRSALLNGELPIYEPGLKDLIRRQVQLGQVNFTADFSEAVPQSDFAIIAVNTPPLENGHADTNSVIAAAQSILEHVSSGMIIVIKSTVPVGTGDQISELVKKFRRDDIAVVSNPEFLREGSAIKDFMNPDRIVIGSENPQAGAAVAGLYENIDTVTIICSRRSAELAKYASNTFLATRISLINEISAVCDASGADIEEIIEIVGSDRRIGPAYLQAGLGWGGSCFPKDLKSLVAFEKMVGFGPSLAAAAMAVNLQQRERALDWLLTAVMEIEAPTVGILGLAFKPNTDDIRESPAMDIAERLIHHGISVRAHDPKAMEVARSTLPEISYCLDAYDAARGCDAVLLATEWQDYMALDWSRIRSAMRGIVVFDGRNILDRELLCGLGFNYLALGRGEPVTAKDAVWLWPMEHGPHMGAKK